MNQNSTPMDIQAEVREHADAIIRTCSYPQYNTDQLIAHTPPDQMAEVKPSLQSPFEFPPVAKLGMIEKLPAELIFMILRHLDIRSFFYFRQVNRLARVFSHGIKEYRIVSAYGLEGLRCLIRAGIAHCFTMFDLYQPLITDKCSACGDSGGILSLFTAERCCYSCLRVRPGNLEPPNPRYAVIPRNAFLKTARISMSTLQRIAGPALTSLKVVPGKYGGYERRSTALPYNVKFLVLAERASRMLLAANAITQPTAEALNTLSLMRMYSCDLPFAAATAYPWYNMENDKIEFGVGCRGCLQERSRDTTFRTYSTEAFLSHFSTCDKVQRLWTMSGRGKWRWLEMFKIRMPEQWYENAGFQQRIVPRGRSYNLRPRKKQRI